MSHNLNLRRGFTAFVLLVALLFASLPAQARPTRGAVSGPWKVAVLGEDAFAWVRSLFAGLWTRSVTKEGVTIDPNGGRARALDDEGVLIDPNG